MSATPVQGNCPCKCHPWNGATLEHVAPCGCLDLRHSRADIGQLIKMMEGTVAQAVNERQVYKHRARMLASIAAELIDDDPCMIDHDGNCQTHNYFVYAVKESECATARLRRVLEDIRENP